ncbi:MAG: MerR family transcriptional regulator, partial [Hyphomicrobiales bacterium]
MDKATGAYRTISEVAEDLDIPQHVLRFWETRFPQIKPMKRSGGRRYYRPGDVLLLRGIRRLLYGEGYTIKGVQRILSSQGVGVVQQAGGASGEELLAAADMEEEGGPAMGTEDELPSRQDEQD